VALYVAPERTPLWVTLGLVCMTALVIYPMLHLPWVRNATSKKSKAVRTSGALLGVAALIVLFGWAVWPKSAPTRTEAKIEELRTEIRSLLEPLGDNVSRQKLLAKYPLGYVIFDVDYKNSVFPYESQAVLDKYEFDWSVVKFTQNTRGQIALRFPNVGEKGKKSLADNIFFQGERRVGQFPAGSVFGDVFMRGEILAFRQNGVVFLVGFEPTPDVIKHIPRPMD
jgi:hypothetical protein